MLRIICFTYAHSKSESHRVMGSDESRARARPTMMHRDDAAAMMERDDHSFDAKLSFSIHTPHTIKQCPVGGQHDGHRYGIEREK